MDHSERLNEALAKLKQLSPDDLKEASLSVVEDFYNWPRIPPRIARCQVRQLSLKM
jgi:hypothetical protein